MGILDEDIARVREATDVAAVIGEVVALKRAGNRWVGLCPFHSEKSPSFSVNTREGLYYCFGCQAHGDIITFVRDTQHLDFAGAVEWLAARAGIQLRYDSPGASRDQQRRGVLIAAVGRAVDWYHERLIQGQDAAAARRYLRERGYDGDVVRAFNLGWAPEGWDELSRALRLPADVLRDAGLAFRGKAGKEIDVFRSRVMFPIFDVDGKAVAFGGRVLPGGEGPKYKNSQEGALYSKRRILYGLNWAKDDIVRAGEVIVCEGYTDVIAFHRAGMPRAVATCGTALTDEHMNKLKNFARRVILAYDADSAGQGAAERFYEWERKLELDIHVLKLPPGADPGSTEPKALQAAVEDARPFLAFRLDRIFEAADLSTAEGRARAADRALQAIATHPNDLVRDQYVMQVADRCRINDPNALRRHLGELQTSTAKPSDGRKVWDERKSRDPRTAAGGRSTTLKRPLDSSTPNPERSASPDMPAKADASRRGAAATVRPVGPGHGAEVEALRLAIHRPEDVAHLAEEVLFDEPVHRAALRALIDSSTLADAIEQAHPQAQALLHRLAVEDPDPDTDPDDVFALLVRLAAGRAIAAIEAEARASQTAVDLRWPKERVEALGDTNRRVEAAGQLVAWLSGAGEEGA